MIDTIAGKHSAQAVGSGLSITFMVATVALATVGVMTWYR